MGEYVGNCRFIKLCPILNAGASSIPATERESYRRDYCKADHLACARYLVATAIGRDNVPIDLIPPESARAYKLMRNPSSNSPA
jgi:hypothetical protein